MISKIVLVGEQAVGKSTIRERYLGISFRQSYLQTVGADYTVKEQAYTKSGKSMTLQIWDLAGQVGFSNIRESYYKGTDGVILAFDVSKPKTAEKISDWVAEIKSHINHTIPIILVGNKIDLRDGNANSLSYESGLELAQTISKSFNNAHIDYIESSAKTGEGIADIFRNIAVKINNYKSRNKKTEDPEKTSFEEYFDEVNEHIQLFFFKLLDDGPGCVAQTVPADDPELMYKMAIYYSTVLGQGANEHTGLFGPFPIPRTEDSNFSLGQSLVYSFKIPDASYVDIRARGVNYCFIVITIAKDLLFQFKVTSIDRFFFDKISSLKDAQEITSDFLLSLKIDLLNNVYILNY